MKRECYTNFPLNLHRFLKPLRRNMFRSSRDFASRNSTRLLEAQLALVLQKRASTALSVTFIVMTMFSTSFWTTNTMYITTVGIQHQLSWKPARLTAALRLQDRLRFLQSSLTSCDRTLPMDLWSAPRPTTLITKGLL